MNDKISALDVIAFLLAFFGTPLALIGLTSDTSDNTFSLLFSVAVGWGIIRTIRNIYNDEIKKRRTKKDYRSFSDTRSNYLGNEASESIITKVVGVTFEGRQNVVASISVGEKLRLVPEPDNRFDSNAVKLLRQNGQQVGYLNKDLAKDIQWHFQSSVSTQYAKVIEIIGNRHRGQSLGVVIEISSPSISEVMISDYLKYPVFGSPFSNVIPDSPISIQNSNSSNENTKLDLPLIESKWENIYQIARQRNPKISALLHSSKPLEFQNNCLVLGFNGEFSLRKSKEMTSEYLEIFEEALGFPIHLKFVRIPKMTKQGQNLE